LLTFSQRGLPAAAGGISRAGFGPAEVLDVPALRRDFEIVLESGATAKAARGIPEESGEVGEGGFGGEEEAFWPESCGEASAQADSDPEPAWLL
jgi:hypothetical protein